MSVDRNVLIPESTPTVVVIDEAKEQQEREEIEKVRKKKIEQIFILILFYWIVANVNITVPVRISSHFLLQILKLHMVLLIFFNDVAHQYRY